MEPEKIELRPYRPSDLDALERLFYETILSVNAADYSAQQLDAWAPGKIDRARWDAGLREHFTRIAVIGEQIVGFGDLDADGYLDRLYVHRDFLRHGIARAICDALEAHACALGVPEVTTHASITARPFFEKRGYRVVREQQVERAGILLTNYVMTYRL